MVRARIFPGFVLLLLTVCWTPTYAQHTTVYPLAKTGGGGENYMHNFYLPPPASTPWRPSFSPDGKQIAFSMAGSIWRIGVDSDTAYELTASTTYDSSPVWSPDGRWIAYTADDNYQSVNLRLLNVATGETSALTVGSHVNVDPTWSPDGTRILYVSTAPNGRYQLYELTVKNGRPGQSTQLTEDHLFHNERLYFGVHDLHIQPTVSPDGTKMIFVSNRGIPLGSGAIWQAPIQPNAMEKAQMILREETLYRTRPQWSPDGTRIVYSSHRGSQYSNLYVLPVDGGEPYQLTFGAWDHFEPRWSPDGKWIIYVSNQPGVSELRLLQVFGGKDRKVEIRKRVHRRPMGTLDVRVFDADTGLPTEARIYLRASDGKAYTPTNAYHRIGSRATHEDFFHTSGQFVLNVPEGETSIVAMKGFERLPVQTKLVVEAGDVTLVRLDLKRFTNLKAKGWYSGSDHIHMNYAGNLHNTPDNVLFMSAAEDIDMVGVKIANKDNRIFDHQYFSGAYDKRRSTSQRLISFGQEYRPPFHGHVNFINLTQHLISPFTTGYEGTAIESLYPSNTDMFLLGKKQGALTGYVHPFDRDPVSVGYAKARAFPVDVALGMVDYIEVMTSAMYAKHTSRVLHRILNCGFKITYSGGEDSISDLHRTRAVGAARVYAHLGNKLDWKRWVDAIASGRTFVSNGPLIGLEINGEISGGEIHLSPEGGSVEVHAWLETAFPVDKLELLFNGKVVDSFTTENGGRHANIRKIVDVTTSGWFGLRARTESPVKPIDDTHLHAETGAIYVYKGKQPIRSQEDAEYFVQWIREITNQAERHPGWRSEKEKRYVLEQFNEARRIYEQRAQEGR